MNIGILTISDKGSQGQRQDKSGEAIRNAVASVGKVVKYEIVPDEKDVIAATLKDWADGGNVELIEVTSDGVVKLKLKGSCGCCPMSSMTLKNGIEKILRQEVPEIKEVIAL